MFHYNHWSILIENVDRECFEIKGILETNLRKNFWSKRWNNLDWVTVKGKNRLEFKGSTSKEFCVLNNWSSYSGD